MIDRINDLNMYLPKTVAIIKYKNVFITDNMVLVPGVYDKTNEMRLTHNSHKFANILVMWTLFTR